MAALNIALMASIFGYLGTVGSFLVYLAPLPTFYYIFKKKSTFGFPSLPYSVALFSAMLTLYYAFLKKDSMMLVAINAIGCLIETVYLVVFVVYSPAKSRIYTAKFIVLFNILGYGLVVLCTCLIPKDALRLQIVGWVTIVFGVGVFAAPLIIMKDVIKTRSVEFMSFWLSLSLTLCAIMWFFHGLLIKDLFIAAPNVLGFIFGVVQMIMFCIYRKKTNKADLPKYIVKDQITPTTEIIALPVNDEKTVEIFISTQVLPKAGDVSSESDNQNNQIDQAMMRPKSKVAAMVTVLRLVLRRASI